MCWPIEMQPTYLSGIPFGNKSLVWVFFCATRSSIENFRLARKNHLQRSLSYFHGWFVVDLQTGKDIRPALSSHLPPSGNPELNLLPNTIGILNCITPQCLQNSSPRIPAFPQNSKMPPMIWRGYFSVITQFKFWKRILWTTKILKDIPFYSIYCIIILGTVETNNIETSVTTMDIRPTDHWVSDICWSVFW